MGSDPRPPFPLMLLSLLGFALALGLALDGLRLRLFGTSLLWLWSYSPILHWANLLNLVPQDLAWPLVIGATSWLGALCGLWLRLSWARKALLLLLGVSFFYFGPGTLVAVMGIVCLQAAPTRRWLAQGPDLGAG